MHIGSFTCLGPLLLFLMPSALQVQQCDVSSSACRATMITVSVNALLPAYKQLGVLQPAPINKAGIEVLLAPR